jgi:hypothetical protein
MVSGGVLNSTTPYLMAPNSADASLHLMLYYIVFSPLNFIVAGV